MIVLKNFENFSIPYGAGATCLRSYASLTRTHFNGPLTMSLFYFAAFPTLCFAANTLCVRRRTRDYFKPTTSANNRVKPTLARGLIRIQLGRVSPRGIIVSSFETFIHSCNKICIDFFHFTLSVQPYAFIHARILFCVLFST